MTVLADLFPPADLQAEIDAGYVSRKQHPTLPLSIYTYGRSCQYENHWTPVTTRTRGLVVDDTDGRIVAHCLPKFFAAAMHGAYDFAPALPEDEPFEIFDKVDGSLGIVFHYDGAWRVASKGSFISEQATWAQAWLDKAGPDGLLEPGLTYLAEIVYPENRIVVNNGDERTLVLLAVYDGDGREHPAMSYADIWEVIGGRVVQSWRSLPLPELMRMAEENTKIDGTAATGTDAEGWVVRFASGVRCKIKYAEYARLHKALTGTNARDVWRYLGAERFAGLNPKTLAQTLGCSPAEAAQLAAVEGGALSVLLDQVPDEFDSWVRGVVADLEARFDRLADVITKSYAQIAHLDDNRAEFAHAAQQIQDRTVRAAMFSVLDGRPVDALIWKSIRPEPSDPFRNDEEG
jgi:RNA ligase